MTWKSGASEKILTAHFLKLQCPWFSNTRGAQNEKMSKLHHTNDINQAAAQMLSRDSYKCYTFFKGN